MDDKALLRLFDLTAFSGMIVGGLWIIFGVSKRMRSEIASGKTGMTQNGLKWFIRAGVLMVLGGVWFLLDDLIFHLASR